MVALFGYVHFNNRFYKFFLFFDLAKLYIFFLFRLSSSFILVGKKKPNLVDFIFDVCVMFVDYLANRPTIFPSLTKKIHRTTYIVKSVNNIYRKNTIFSCIPNMCLVPTYNFEFVLALHYVHGYNKCL